MSPRYIADFWREWRASQGLPTRVKPVPRDDVTPVTESVSIAPAQRPLRINDKVTCDQPTGLFRPCDRCESNRFIVRPGKGPHAGRIVCLDCGRRSRWLSRAIMETA